ncbi:hypothetical protein [Neorhizobium sp. T6_25]|uniref:hypothetical protein n=1 Tax=Neorhizobium sp. T6_25 TaxID=2093833 RepID=UPI000CF88129|nr:hypothetical protein [Neorhizobium sp. T6_25]
MSGRETAKAELLTLLEKTKNKEAALAAISFLFPRSRDLLGDQAVETVTGSDGVGRRIAKADFAPMYFRLTPDKSLWSKSQVEELKEGDPNTTFQVFQSRLNAVGDEQRPKLRRLILEILEDILQSQDDMSAWFLAVFNNAIVLVGDEDWKNAALFDASNEDFVRILLRQALNRCKQDDRVALLRKSIAEADDISLLCELMRSVSGDNIPEGTDYKEDVLGETTQELRSELLNRVRKMAADGVLHSQVRPADILWYWWGTGNGDEVLEYTKQLATVSEGLRVLMAIPISYVRSTAGNYEKVDVRAWSKIVDLDELEKRAMILSMSESADDQPIAHRFLTALAKGKGRDF